MLHVSVGLQKRIGRAGLIFHVEGKAQVVGESEPVSSDKRLRHLEAGEHLRTQEGRVEVILATGLILRVGENTEFEMVKAHLSDLTVRLISGSAILYVVSNAHSGSLSVLSGDKVVKFQKLGVYRLNVPADKSLGLNPTSSPSCSIRLIAGVLGAKVQ